MDRLLVIEDSASDAAWIGRLASQQGFEPLCVLSFDHLGGLELEDFDLALVDLHLGGDEVEETVAKALALPIPVVAMTGVMNEDQAEAIGFDHGLTVMGKGTSQQQFRLELANKRGIAKRIKAMDREIEELAERLAEAIHEMV